MQAQARCPQKSNESPPREALFRVVAVSALGYFVDILDLFLFSVLRIPSLRSVGVLEAHFLPAGAMLLNCQMAGLLVGSFAWGVLGDRQGRLRALYGSILLYSLATLANAFVLSLPAYAVCRFLAGLGLGGELGTAVTLVSETLPKHRRGLGTMVVAGLGLCGGIVAATLAEHLPWRTCYGIGGTLGLILFSLRVRVSESPLFLPSQSRMRISDFVRLLFGNARRCRLYLRLVLVGVPIWFVAGILMVFSPELGRALGVASVTAPRAVLYSYLGVAIGDFLSGLLSQLLCRRKRTIYIFLGLLFCALLFFLRAEGVSTTTFYILCFALGLGTGYWAVLVTMAAEHFGTNLRATCATTVPNFVRATAIPLSLAFQALADKKGAALGLIGAAAVLGIASLGLAVFALAGLDETFSRDLHFREL